LERLVVINILDYNFFIIYFKLKGRPLQFGNSVVEEVSNQYPVDERGYIIRECRPLSFSFKTMCYDINNFFTCASMRTGLPRWFFVSTILLSSLLMFWLGIFMLSMIRRMKRVQVRNDELK
jgi:hypothetical protein